MSLKKLLALPVVIGLIFALSVGAILGFRYLVSAPSSDSSPVSLSIAQGQSVSQIATTLEKEGLIRSALVYRIFVRLSGFESKLQAGTFKLTRDLPMKDLTYRLSRGTTDQTITTLEGWRLEEIAESLEKKQIITKDEFLEAAAKNYSYDFLPNYSGSLDHPYRKLEGYLFPDTYQIAAQSSAETIINTMLKNFSVRVTAQMRSDAVKNKLTLDETMRLASIVEREGAKDADRALVAGILIKRFQTPGWKIESDVTVQFALGYEAKNKTWWRKDITSDDLNIDSAYNTRKNGGLPPTPIASPGLSSIKATLYPKASDYWFYVADSAGITHYARTIEEHTANIQKYNVH